MLLRVQTRKLCRIHQRFMVRTGKITLASKPRPMPLAKIKNPMKPELLYACNLLYRRRCSQALPLGPT